MLALLKGTGEGRSIILNGHVDTVPADDLDKWQANPWESSVVDGRVYGRGIADMKGGVAAMILATRFLQESGVELKGNVMIQCVVDEEGGGNSSLACVAEGYRADAAIVTEPSQLQAQPIGRGVLLLQIDVTGESSHACYKWEGVNAIEKSLKMVGALHELEHEWLAKRKNPLLPSPSINLGFIKGGLAAPIVTDECTIKLDIKYLPEEIDHNTGEMIKEEVEQRIHDICQSDAWLLQHPPVLEWYFLHVMPHNLDPQHELVTTATSITEELFGWSKVSGLPSGSDARHLLNSGGIPSIVFGPGDMRMAHTIDESIAIDEYINGIKALALIIMDWNPRIK